ncbi:MAG: ankyrin repeat domain-containing protein [Clostridiales bacterium]|nr:ankyrin repeat domain-containing protein [Clostridiales bacterium]
MAAGSGDFSKVKKLVESGADINVTDAQAGATALHKACQGGHLDIVKYLLENGIQINATIELTGHTPLMDAIWFKQVACCKYLLEHDAEIGIMTHYGFTIDDHIAFAIKVNSKETEKEKLLKIKEYVEKRRQRDKERETEPLFQAVLSNDLEGVKQAISKGADIEMRYPMVNGFNDGHTPLIIAARDNKKDIVEYLLSMGADANAIEPVFGAVPLHKATYNGLPDILRILLRVEGINVNYQGSTNGYTPIHDALWHGFEECARILLDYGVDLSLKGHDGKLPVDIAVEVFGEDADITWQIRNKMK